MIKYDLLLLLDLQYFAEQGEGQGEEAQVEQEGEYQNNEQGEGQGEEEAPSMVTKEQFDEVNNARKAMKAELEALQAELESKQAESIEEAENTGDFKELYDTTVKEIEAQKAELETVNNRHKEIEATLETIVEKKVSALDEKFHELIPEKLSPLQKLEWLNAAEAKGVFGQVKQSNVPMGQQSNPKVSTNVDMKNVSPFDMMIHGYNK